MLENTEAKFVEGNKKTGWVFMEGFAGLGVVCGMALVFVAGVSRADIVVDYNGQTSGGYVTDNSALWMNKGDFDLPIPTAAEERKVWGFDSSSPLISSVSNNRYTGPAIYGGFQVDEEYDLSSVSGINTALFTNSSFGIVESKGDGHLAVILAFKPNVNPGQTVTFDASSVMTFRGVIMADDVMGKFRFIVQSDGQWYISRDLPPERDDERMRWTISGADAELFAPFQPEDKAPLPPLPEDDACNIPGSSFKNITMVGYYIVEVARSNPHGTFFAMDEFQVDAKVAP